MDTCIALRTMMVKDGVAYLQAGGGIVFDSDPYEEWVETMNKLGANMQCISSAEKLYTRIQGNGNRGVEKSTVDTAALSTKHVGSRAHIELAAG